MILVTNELWTEVTPLLNRLVNDDRVTFRDCLFAGEAARLVPPMDGRAKIGGCVFDGCLGNDLTTVAYVTVPAY